MSMVQLLAMEMMVGGKMDVMVMSLTTLSKAQARLTAVGRDVPSRHFAFLMSTPSLWIIWYTWLTPLGNSAQRVSFMNIGSVHEKDFEGNVFGAPWRSSGVKKINGLSIRPERSQARMQPWFQWRERPSPPSTLNINTGCPKKIPDPNWMVWTRMAISHYIKNFFWDILF